MAIESMVVLCLATALLAGLAWYASRHRSEDHKKHHDQPTLEVLPHREHNRSPLDVLCGSVVRYDNPMQPVAENDWDAAQ